MQTKKLSQATHHFSSVNPKDIKFEDFEDEAFDEKIRNMTDEELAALPVDVPDSILGLF